MGGQGPASNQTIPIDCTPFRRNPSYPTPHTHNPRCLVRVPWRRRWCGRDVCVLPFAGARRRASLHETHPQLSAIALLSPDPAPPVPPFNPSLPRHAPPFPPPKKPPTPHPGDRSKRCKPPNRRSSRPMRPRPRPRARPPPWTLSWRAVRRSFTAAWRPSCRRVGVASGCWDLEYACWVFHPAPHLCVRDSSTIATQP